MCVISFTLCFYSITVNWKNRQGKYSAIGIWAWCRHNLEEKAKESPESPVML